MSGSLKSVLSGRAPAVKSFCEPFPTNDLLEEEMNESRFVIERILEYLQR